MTLDLDELGRIASAATPGPWEISSWHPSDPDGYAEIHADEPEGQVVRLPLAAPNAVRNTAHIATFNPVTVLALISRARDAERAAVLLAEYRALRSKGIFNLSDAEMTRMQVLPGLIADLLSTLNEGDE